MSRNTARVLDSKTTSDSEMRQSALKQCTPKRTQSWLKQMAGPSAKIFTQSAWMAHLDGTAESERPADSQERLRQPLRCHRGLHRVTAIPATLAGRAEHCSPRADTELCSPLVPLLPWPKLSRTPSMWLGRLLWGCPTCRTLISGLAQPTLSFSKQFLETETRYLASLRDVPTWSKEMQSQCKNRSEKKSTRDSGSLSGVEGRRNET